MTGEGKPASPGDAGGLGGWTCGHFALLARLRVLAFGASPWPPLVVHSMRLAGFLLYYSRLPVGCGTEALLSSQAGRSLYSLAKFALWQGGLALAAASSESFVSLCFQH